MPFNGAVFERGGEFTHSHEWARLYDLYCSLVFSVHVAEPTYQHHLACYIMLLHTTSKNFFLVSLAKGSYRFGQEVVTVDVHPSDCSQGLIVVIGVGRKHHSELLSSKHLARCDQT